MNTAKDIVASATELIELCRARNLRLATVESCTGGLISAALTDIPGASDVFEGGFVTYSNEAKQAAVGVKLETLMNFGAVSHDVAAEMAAGAVAKDRIDAAVSVTGVAGPGGGTVEKPVGLVFIGAALADKPAIAERHQFKGDRQAVRAASVAAALTMLINLIGESSSA